MVYLDYNATAPLRPEAFAAMQPVLQHEYGNASSIHALGRQSRALIDDARDRFARLIGARPHEIIFTSGGTEADNLAILGLARQLSSQGRHLISSPTEHHAVLHVLEYLRDHEGFFLELLPVDRWGRVNPDDLRAAIRPDTILVSVMSANNETGTIQPVQDLAAVCREREVLFHSDMIQSFGKQVIRPHELNIDAAVFASHKFYGPKGVGVLFLRAGQSLQNILFGGAHENQRRPGTENVAAIVGMVVAAEQIQQEASDQSVRLQVLRERLWEGIQDICPEAIRNTPEVGALANTLNVSFPGADGEALLMGFDLEGVCVSSGSACMVGSVVPSHVLTAVGIKSDVAAATVRFSAGFPTMEDDINFTIQAFAKIWERQRLFRHS